MRDKQGAQIASPLDAWENDDDLEALRIHWEVEEEIAAEEMLELALTDLINWLDPQDILPHLGMSYEENQARC